MRVLVTGANGMVGTAVTIAPAAAVTASLRSQVGLDRGRSRAGVRRGRSGCRRWPATSPTSTRFARWPRASTSSSTWPDRPRWPHRSPIRSSSCEPTCSAPPRSSQLCAGPVHPAAGLRVVGRGVRPSRVATRWTSSSRWPRGRRTARPRSEPRASSARRVAATGARRRRPAAVLGLRPRDAARQRPRGHPGAGDLAGESIRLRKLDGVRDYCYVGDLADAVWRAATGPLSGLRTFNIASGRGTRADELARAALTAVHGRGPHECDGGGPTGDRDADRPSRPTSRSWSPTSTGPATTSAGTPPPRWPTAWRSRSTGTPHAMAAR